MIVFVFGLPGTGKSYFAKKLAERINAKYINSDRLRKELFATRTYSKQEKQEVYKEMLRETQKAIDQNVHVVLDATFHKKDIRKMFVDEIRNKSKIFFIEITADKDLIRERLRKQRTYSEADFEVYKLIQQEWEPLNETHLILESTDDNIHQMLQKAIEHLEKEP